MDERNGRTHRADRLVEAARDGDAAAGDRLLRAGVAPDAPDGGGVTALEAAVRPGHAEVVDLLLEFGADLEGRQRDMTPLERVAGPPRADVVHHLLARGAAPTLRARDRAVWWGARRHPEKTAVFKEIVAALGAAAAAREKEAGA